MISEVESYLPRDVLVGPNPEDLDVKDWQRSAAPFASPHLGRSVLALASSVVPYLALWALMYFSLSISYLITLALAVPTVGFLLRTYILFHDCTHGSLLKGRRANEWLGSVLALMVFTPFARWRHDHVGHHATAGDLDRRGVGDVPTITLAEYEARSFWGRLGYRLFRNPLVMFGIGPIYGMLLMPRWISRSARPRIQRSVWRTNVAIVLSVGALCLLVGWQAFLLVEAPLIVLGGAAGLWLFYVQHQFADTYWGRSGEWRFTDAALRGSSYLRLPRVLRFFTGNIGLHHVHHLNPKIPSYNLQRAHDKIPVLRDVHSLSLWQGVQAVRLKLWDERTSRLLTWAEVRNQR